MNAITRILKKVWWIGASLLFVEGNTAFAQQLENPLGSATFQSVADNVTQFLVVIAAPICGILVIVGGFQMMTAAGDPEKFSKGKKTLLYAAIGFVAVLLAGGAATLIKNILSGQ